MYRQRNNKDCAVTAVAQALGIPYTTVINLVPQYRFKRMRPRLHRERLDRIVGRSRRVKTHKPIYGTVNPYEGEIKYNNRYRVYREPYFSGFGLSPADYMPIIQRYAPLYVRETTGTVEMLRHVRFALLSVPSLNFPGSGHMVIWRNGQIFDPSPKKRYTYGDLRRANRMTILAIARDVGEQMALRQVLQVPSTGEEIMITLAWTIKTMSPERRAEIEAIKPLRLLARIDEWNVAFDEGKLIMDAHATA
jgi:hypothetical protein